MFTPDTLNNITFTSTTEYTTTRSTQDTITLDVSMLQSIATTIINADGDLGAQSAISIIAGLKSKFERILASTEASLNN